LTPQAPFEFPEKEIPGRKKASLLLFVVSIAGRVKFIFYSVAIAIDLENMAMMYQPINDGG
jgi:hypothetical protein